MVRTNAAAKTDRRKVLKLFNKKHKSVLSGRQGPRASQTRQSNHSQSHSVMTLRCHCYNLTRVTCDVLVCVVVKHLAGGRVGDSSAAVKVCRQTGYHLHIQQLWNQWKTLVPPGQAIDSIDITTATLFLFDSLQDHKDLGGYHLLLSGNGHVTKRQRNYSGMQCCSICLFVFCLQVSLVDHIFQDQAAGVQQAFSKLAKANNAVAKEAGQRQSTVAQVQNIYSSYSLN